MIPETVAQCSYNTAYKALHRVRDAEANVEKMGVLDVVM